VGLFGALALWQESRLRVALDEVGIRVNGIRTRWSLRWSEVRAARLGLDVIQLFTADDAFIIIHEPFDATALWHGVRERLPAGADHADAPMLRRLHANYRKLLGDSQWRFSYRSSILSLLTAIIFFLVLCAVALLSAAGDTLLWAILPVLPAAIYLPYLIRRLRSFIRITVTPAEITVRGVRDEITVRWDALTAIELDSHRNILRLSTPLRQIQMPLPEDSGRRAALLQFCGAQLWRYNFRPEPNADAPERLRFQRTTLLENA
jgi:hypothetical protein